MWTQAPALASGDRPGPFNGLAVAEVSRKKLPGFSEFKSFGKS